MHATCFGLFLGHHQARKYKNLIKEDKINKKKQNLRGLFFTVSVF
jgi:hypothetical protein